MKLEVFSDMVCPWCYIGKRRLDLALESVDVSVEVVWRSFQLDPDYPTDVRWTLPQAHLRRYGLSQAQNDERLALVTGLARDLGLRYDLDRAVMANTFQAHRLVHHGTAHGKGSDVAEALMRAFAVEGRWIGDPRTLDEIAAEVGLPPLDEPNAYEAEVLADRERAAAYGILGVPTVVIDESRALVSPETDHLVHALRSAARAG